MRGQLSSKRRLGLGLYNASLGVFGGVYTRGYPPVLTYPSIAREARLGAYPCKQTLSTFILVLIVLVD